MKKRLSLLLSTLISALLMCPVAFAAGGTAAAQDDPLLGKKIIASGLILFAGAFLLIRRRKNRNEDSTPKSKKEKVKKEKAKKKSKASAPAPVPGPQFNQQTGAPSDAGKTVYMGGDLINKTVYMGSSHPMAGGNTTQKMAFSLRDVNSNMVYEAIVSIKNDFAQSISFYEATIGRAHDNDIVVDFNPTISAHHCRIVVSGDTAQIYDLQSKNGTNVDGNPVAGSAPRSISNGSMLRIGEVAFRFEYRVQTEDYTAATLW